jgi:hypothetical protein
MTTQEMVDALISVLTDFLSVKENDSGYNLEVDNAKQLLVILEGYPWS